MKACSTLLTQINETLTTEVANEAELVGLIDQAILHLQSYRDSLKPMSAAEAFQRLQQVASELDGMSRSSSIDLDKIVPLVGAGLAAEGVIRGVISSVESQLNIMAESRK